ncbi:ribonuclease Y, partial [bacterium]|nr:ribonuclease Y [bacterium]
EAKREAEAKRRETLLETKDISHKREVEFERGTQKRRQEIERLSRGLSRREEELNRKVDLLEKKEKDLNLKENKFLAREKSLTLKEERLKVTLEEERKNLERLSGLTREEAKKMLLANLRREVTQEQAMVIKEAQDRAREEADRKAKEIISTAIQRCAPEYTAETTVSTVSLPSDEMKGRIIGREGRNIRAFEAATGIDLIVDDTPEAVVLSGFDPVRRQIANIALKRLIADGRIQPARIEETVAKAKREMEDTIRKVGQETALEVGVSNLHPEEIKLLGRLKFRTSYGQNVLEHSKEVAHLAGMMAAELGANAKVAKRAGLLHDIGKAVDHEVEGTHARIGADLARRYRESPQIIQAIISHHEEVEPKSVEAVLVLAADAISASRPGVRRETLERYVKRLERLENIAESFSGIQKSYCIQAGREIRIMVETDKVSDARAVQLARDISKKIEKELEYPGQIKVTVIREKRAVEYAK